MADTMDALTLLRVCKRWIDAFATALCQVMVSANRDVLRIVRRHNASGKKQCSQEGFDNSRLARHCRLSYLPNKAKCVVSTDVPFLHRNLYPDRDSANLESHAKFDSLQPPRRAEQRFPRSIRAIGWKARFIDPNPPAMIILRLIILSARLMRMLSPICFLPQQNHHGSFNNNHGTSFAVVVVKSTCTLPSGWHGC